MIAENDVSITTDIGMDLFVITATWDTHSGYLPTMVYSKNNELYFVPSYLYFLRNDNISYTEDYANVAFNTKVDCLRRYKLSSNIFPIQKQIVKLYGFFGFAFGVKYLDDSILTWKSNTYEWKFNVQDMLGTWNNGGIRNTYIDKYCMHVSLEYSFCFTETILSVKAFRD